MASEMGCKAVFMVITVLLGIAAAKVELTGEWKPNFGWEVRCSWRTLINDTLHSVRLFRNGRQYVMFRPETNGQKLNISEANSEFVMNIECKIGTPSGQRGRCVTTVELLARPENLATDLYRCEVSGERPTFLEEKMEYEALVPPSSATVTGTLISESSVQVLNCSSFGIPPPKLVWSVQGRPIPEVFTGTTWDYGSKLWHTWSTLTHHFDPSEGVTCTPEVVSRDRQQITGAPYTVNAAADLRNNGIENSGNCHGDGFTKIFATSVILLLSLLK